MAVNCTHLDQIQVTEPPVPVEGCETCLELGMQWVHLRMCETCGRIGCCDSSPGQHATKHAHAESHPILRSVEPGEGWSFCVVDEAMFEIAPPGPGA